MYSLDISFPPLLSGIFLNISKWYSVSFITLFCSYGLQSLHLISVPMVVRVKTDEILGFDLVKMQTKGTFAQISKDVYQWNIDERQKKFEGMLIIINGFLIKL